MRSVVSGGGGCGSGFRKKLMVLYFQNLVSGMWIAHCMEFPIFVQARSFDEVQVKFGVMVAAYVEHCFEVGRRPFCKVVCVSDYLELIWDEGSLLDYRTCFLVGGDFVVDLISVVGCSGTVTLG